MLSQHSHRNRQGRGLVWPPWEAEECVHSQVTGCSVFICSVIPGVYVGFSFLAREKEGVERGREGERGGERERGVERGRGGWEVLIGVMEGDYCWRKKIFSFIHSLLHMGAPQECRKRCRNSVYKTNLAQQTAGVLHSDPRLSPSPHGSSSLPTSTPTHCLPALKMGWNSTFSFSLLSLSVQTAKKEANWDGGFLMWVPVPQDWNKAGQLIPGLPA